MYTYVDYLNTFYGNQTKSEILTMEDKLFWKTLKRWVTVPFSLVFSKSTFQRKTLCFVVINSGCENELGSILPRRPILR